MNKEVIEGIYQRMMLDNATSTITHVLGYINKEKQTDGDVIKALLESALKDIKYKTLEMRKAVEKGDII